MEVSTERCSLRVTLQTCHLPGDHSLFFLFVQLSSGQVCSVPFRSGSRSKDVSYKQGKMSGRKTMGPAVRDPVTGPAQGLIFRAQRKFRRGRRSAFPRRAVPRYRPEGWLSPEPGANDAFLIRSQTGRGGFRCGRLDPGAPANRSQGGAGREHRESDRLIVPKKNRDGDLGGVVADG